MLPTEVTELKTECSNLANTAIPKREKLVLSRLFIAVIDSEFPIRNFDSSLRHR